MSDPQKTADAVLKGNVRIAARLMRDLDDVCPSAIEVMKRIYPHTGRAFLLGVTGNPGAGKSTVVDALISLYRAQQKRVGVVAVDPSSPFSGGAILGDRIRMQRHATDSGVFIRSLATRGHLGGLSRSTSDVASVLDAMGFDVVIIETVGVGQDEVEVVSQVDASIVVTVPGLGDDIQAIKAGILEIADILVVNKSDREGADRTVRDLVSMLELRGHDSAPVEIVRTVATTGKGIDELANAIERFRARNSDDSAARSRKRAEVTVRELVLDKFRRLTDGELRAHLDLLEAVARRTLDPYSAAETMIQHIGKKSD